jgi:prepilin-type N-terminal cleavage/methylation domain-containing protein
MRTQEGFTIVELLIVIIVIAILAAITVSAYNGAQNRAKNSQYLTDVATIAKKSELYPHASGTGLYPLASAGPDSPTDTSQTNAGKLLTSGINSYTETKLPSNIVVFGVLTAASSNPTNAQAIAAIGNSGIRGYFVRYCSTGKGMYIYYPDVTAAPTVSAPSRTVGVCP